MAKFNMERWTGSPDRIQHARLIPVLALGMALSCFLVVSYLICITTYFIPRLPISHAMLTLFLPGFELLTLRSFVLGLARPVSHHRCVTPFVIGQSWLHRALDNSGFRSAAFLGDLRPNLAWRQLCACPFGRDVFHPEGCTAASVGDGAKPVRGRFVRHRHGRGDIRRRSALCGLRRTNLSVDVGDGHCRDSVFAMARPRLAWRAPDSNSKRRDRRHNLAARMRSRVHFHQFLRIDLRVSLGRGQRSMTEKFLHTTQIPAIG